SGIKPLPGVGDFALLPLPAIPSRVMKTNVVATVAALCARAVHFYGEQDNRIFFFDEVDIGHPGDVVRAALINSREIPGPNRCVRDGGKWRDQRSVTLVNVSTPDEGGIQAVGKIARVVFGRD